MTGESKLFAGLLFILLTTVETGGNFLIKILSRDIPNLAVENHVQFSLFRAGHAHAGVLCILALVAMMYVDQCRYGAVFKRAMRILFLAAPLIMSAGFFAAAGAVKPGDPPGSLIAMVYVGAVCLAVALISLGVGLIHARNDVLVVRP